MGTLAGAAKKPSAPCSAQSSVADVLDWSLKWALSGAKIMCRGSLNLRQRSGKGGGMDLWQLDATDLARLIRVGQASSREAVGACLARMDAVNGKLNAVVRRMDEEALAAADAADEARARGDALGPLHGVPVTIKVNTDQKDHPTDNGVVAFRDLNAPDDAPVVANLRTAGAVIIGRTNVPAFSMRGFSENDLHGRTLNPRDREVTPGGSSGGAGAAAATGIGPI